MEDGLRSRLRAVIAFPDGDPVCTALTAFVNRDLADAAIHHDVNVGWTPLTVQLAQQLRELHHQHGIWIEEPDIIRLVLDGIWE